MSDFSTLIAGLSTAVNNKDVRQAINYILQPAKEEILDKMEATKITALQTYDQQMAYLVDLCPACSATTPNFVSDSCVYALDNQLNTFVEPNLGNLELYKSQLETIKNYEALMKTQIENTLIYRLLQV